MDTISNRLMDTWVSLTSLPILACALAGCSADTGAADATNVTDEATTAAIEDDATPNPESDLRPGVVGDPAVSRDALGRLTVFVRGGDDALWYNVQARFGDRWGRWRRLGGRIDANPAVAPNADGRLSVFVRAAGSGALLSITQVAPNAAFGAWVNHRGILTSQPTVGQNLDGSLEVFVRGTDNAVWVLRQREPNGRRFTPWSSLGGQSAGEITVAPNADGRLSLFIRSTTTAKTNLQYSHQVTSKGPYSAWEPLLGELGSLPAAQRGADGRVDAFYIGFNENALWVVPQIAPNDGFRDHFYQGGFFVIDSKIATSQQADGRIFVVARIPDNGLAYRRQGAPGGVLPGAYVSNPAIGNRADGRLAIFGAGPDGQLWVTTQIAPNGTFGPPTVVE
ncbi:hypothetical protein [Pendulispora albinea]|uniref:PLL-like beta propeller domain-containing protein n=1 Tax=Pendulispora albinea TaxID=2741071 RepID=A0ABZ2LXR1_9BACT